MTLSSKATVDLGKTTSSLAFPIWKGSCTHFKTTRPWLVSAISESNRRTYQLPWETLYWVTTEFVTNSPFLEWRTLGLTLAWPSLFNYSYLPYMWENSTLQSPCPLQTALVFLKQEDTAATAAKYTPDWIIFVSSHPRTEWSTSDKYFSVEWTNRNHTYHSRSGSKIYFHKDFFGH